MSAKLEMETLLAKRRQELEKVIRFIEKQKINESNDKLEVINQDKYYRYCVKKNSAEKEELKVHNRKYLKKDQIDIARDLARRDYMKKTYKVATQELKHVNKMLGVYQNPTMEDCYESLHPGRKLLVAPIIPNDEEYAKEWFKKRSQRVNPILPSKPIETENHEIVRSKSEKIIADKLKLMGVPYKYEEALFFEGKTLFPDFTVLNKKTRKQYYWEHFGMMDDPNYVESVIQKLNFYSKNHIVLGENLIATFEIENQLVSTQVVEALIRSHLIDIS